MAEARDRRDANTYVVLWVALAAIAVGLTWLVGGWPDAPDPIRAVGLLAAVSVAESIHLRFHWDRTTSDFTFTEVAIVATIILVPFSLGLLLIAGGIVVSQAIRRIAPLKVAFNVGQVTVASATAMGVLAAVPSFGPSIAGHAVLSVAAGMAVYVLVNLIALTGLLSRIASQAPRDVLREHGALSTLAVVGNTAIGILVAHVWVTQPALLPVLLAPLAAMQLSYRGTVRTRGLLAQLRTEHERLDRVVLGTSDGIMLLDGRGTIELWNPALVEMTGIPAPEAVGRNVGEVLTSDVRQDGSPTSDRWRMATARPGEPAVSEETVLLLPDGTRRFVRESHTFLFDPRGRCIGDVVLVHDVTRQRELDAMKGDFVARVSHELRTPLTPIRGFAEVLAKRGKDLTPQQRTDAARSIAERAERMTALVEDLLLVARLDDGSYTAVDPLPTDLEPIVARTVGRFRAEHPRRQFHLFVAPGTGTAIADPNRTQQIITNLLDNAARYSPVETSIEVELRQEDDDVCVTVIDHGPGIPLDKQEAVFERFHRLEDPLRMRTSGVGLGLFISRRLAEAMHGSLEVDSTVGEGSRFTLRLPTSEPSNDTGTFEKTTREPTNS